MFRRFCGFAASTLLWTTLTGAAELPDRFRLEPVVSGLTEPAALSISPAGTILIAERTTGNLRAITNGRLDPAPACTVAVETTGEAGLLGVAAHPSFDATGWVFLYYTDLASGKEQGPTLHDRDERLRRRAEHPGRPGRRPRLPEKRRRDRVRRRRETLRRHRGHGGLRQRSGRRVPAGQGAAPQRRRNDPGGQPDPRKLCLRQGPPRRAQLCRSSPRGRSTPSTAAT